MGKGLLGGRKSKNNVKKCPQERMNVLIRQETIVQPVLCILCGGIFVNHLYPVSSFLTKCEVTIGSSNLNCGQAVFLSIRSLFLDMLNYFVLAKVWQNWFRKAAVTSQLFLQV